MSIIGVGIDVAEIDRFRASLERTPGGSPTGCS